MPTLLTPEVLIQYFREEKKSVAYDDIKKIYDALRIHANGEYPTDLIDTQRPSEPSNVLEYRKQIFQPVTKETVSRIITCLSKIRRSADWSVRFDPKTVPAGIIPEESPEEYFDKRYPSFTSLTNWLFSVCLKNYLIDANGICIVVPLNTITELNEYKKPFPFIFNSDQVFDYVENDYTIIYSKDKSSYLASDAKTRYYNGKIFWVITYERVQKWEQTDEKGTMTPTIDFIHGLGYMPAFKLGGIFLKSIDATFIYESRIQTIVPSLNKAAREDNDLDVSVVRHLFPEKWEYVTLDCPKCHGVGKITGTKGTSPTTCTSCKGIGKVVSGPFQSHLLTPTSIDKQAIPAPPAGYVVKDVGIIEHMEKRVRGHKDNALATINMNFLSETPLNESGTAKEVDKDELNNFVHSIAEDLVKIMDEIFAISYDYRYSVRVADKEKRIEMLPDVNVPEKYDMLSVNYLLDEYSKAKTAKMNPILIAQMELEIATKKFSVDPDLADELTTILQLDPFAGKTSDDKMSDAQNQFVTKENSILSANIVEFVRRAKFENDDFYSWEMDKQKEKLMEYVEESLEGMDASKKVRAMVDFDIIQSTQPPEVEEEQPNNDATTSPTGSDIVGKLPLALQQLGLAAERAKTQGNLALSKKIQAKMSELVPLISEDAITGTTD